MNPNETTIDNGLTIPQLRGEIKVCESIKQTDINQIHRLESEAAILKDRVKLMNREIKYFNGVIREIDRLNKRLMKKKP
jgi:hypothetical protein